MRMIDAGKLLDVIAKLHEEHTTREYRDEAALVLEDLEEYIDSLQQEQPEEDLEKEMYDKATSECDIIWNEMDYQLCYDNLIEAFVAGAEWAMKRKEDKQ